MTDEELAHKALSETIPYWALKAITGALYPYPAMRAFALQFNPNTKALLLRCYLDREVNEDDIDYLDSYIGSDVWDYLEKNNYEPEICADLKTEVFYSLAPWEHLDPLDGFVYLRKEETSSLRVIPQAIWKKIIFLNTDEQPKYEFTSYFKGQKWLLYALTQALLGEIYPEIRSILVGFAQHEKILCLRCYLDRNVITEDIESLKRVAAKVHLYAPDYFQLIEIQAHYSMRNRSILANLSNNLMGHIYMRHEDNIEDKIIN